MLLISVPGCGPDHVESAGTTPIAVRIHDRPPAELLACPVAPEEFPVDQAATLPPAVRRALMDLAGAYHDLAGQLRRLIRWNTPGACTAPS